MKRNCFHCNKLLRRNQKKYCSSKCNLTPIVEPKMTNCPNCGTEFKSYFHSGKGQYQKYCSRVCYAGRPAPILNNTCFNCRRTYETKRENSVFCSRKCSDSATMVKYTNNELIYLAMINPGYGFRRFTKTLYNGSDKIQNRCLEVFMAAKEDGIDPYDCLQDPEYMEKIDALEFFEKRGYIPPHSGATGAILSMRGGKGLKHPRRKIKDDSHIEFNWGELGPRKWTRSAD